MKGVPEGAPRGFQWVSEGLLRQWAGGVQQLWRPWERLCASLLSLGGDDVHGAALCGKPGRVREYTEQKLGS